jgi:hypothetical protein
MKITGSLGGVTSGVVGFCFRDTLDNFGAGVAGYGEADNVAGVLAENVAGGWALRVIGPACSTDGWSQGARRGTENPRARQARDEHLGARPARRETRRSRGGGDPFPP